MDTYIFKKDMKIKDEKHKSFIKNSYVDIGTKSDKLFKDNIDHSNFLFCVKFFNSFIVKQKTQDLEELVLQIPLFSNTLEYINTNEGSDYKLAILDLFEKLENGEFELVLYHPDYKLCNTSPAEIIKVNDSLKYIKIELKDLYIEEIQTSYLEYINSSYSEIANNSEYSIFQFRDIITRLGIKYKPSEVVLNNFYNEDAENIFDQGYVTIPLSARIDITKIPYTNIDINPSVYQDLTCNFDNKFYKYFDFIILSNLDTMYSIIKDRTDKDIEDYNNSIIKGEFTHQDNYNAINLESIVGIEYIEAYNKNDKETIDKILGIVF